MVNVVSMANTSRIDDETLTAETRPIATRRWLFVLAAVLTPLVLGALATVVLYATRAQPVIAPSTGAQAADIKGLDGSVLVLQPETAAQVQVPLGTIVEVVLQPGLGEQVVSDDSAILVATPTPACHTPKLCAFPGAHAWTFKAIQGGVAYLRIAFGIHVCRANGVFCTVTPLVLKPIAVFTRPQAS